MFPKIWQLVADHWVLAGVFGFVAYAVLLALFEKIGFQVWYLLVIAVAAIVANATSYPLYFWPFLLGMVTAFAEIINKFDDEPMKALKTLPALLYHVLNGLIAVFALYLLALVAGKSRTFDGVGEMDKLKYAMAAGFGAMLIMRSKLFNIKVGDDNVSFGPEQIINTLFSFMESAIGRIRASERRTFIEQRMKDIDFSKVYEHSVMTLRRALRLNGDDKSLMDLQAVKQNFDSLGSPQPNPEIQLRSYELGYVVYDRMGEEFVSQLFSNPPSEWLLRAPGPESAKTGALPTLIQVEADSALRALPFIGTKPEIEYYLAYGTSMSSNFIRKRLDWMEASDLEKLQKTKPKPGVVKGFRLAFNGTNGDEEGLANLVAEPGGEVHGVLYELPKKAIDFLEQHEPGYHRFTVQVDVTGEKKAIQAIALTADNVGPEQPPRAEHLAAMREGGQENGLNLDYLDKWTNMASRGSIADDSTRLAGKSEGGNGTNGKTTEKSHLN